MERAGEKISQIIVRLKSMHFFGDRILQKLHGKEWKRKAEKG